MAQIVDMVAVAKKNIDSRYATGKAIHLVEVFGIVFVASQFGVKAGITLFLLEIFIFFLAVNIGQRLNVQFMLNAINVIGHFSATRIYTEKMREGGDPEEAWQNASRQAELTDIGIGTELFHDNFWKSALHSLVILVQHLPNLIIGLLLAKLFSWA